MQLLLSHRIVAALDFGQLHTSLPVQISESAMREGFARNTLLHKKLKKGEVGRIRVRKKDVDFVGPGSGGIATSTVRQNYIYPSEYQLTGLITIDDMDLAQDPELAGDAAIQVLESTMVKEDRLWKKMADKVAPVKPFQNFAEMSAALKANNVPAGQWLFGSNVWAKLITSADLLDPVTKRKLIKTGKIDSLYGAKIHTDSHRDPSLKVLDPDEIYLVAKPAFVGAILDRTPLNVQVGKPASGGTKMGIAFNQISSMAMGNFGTIIHRKM